MVSEARKAANKKWDEAHRKRKNYTDKRSSARGFIKIAEKDDLLELLKLLQERINELK